MNALSFLSKEWNYQLAALVTYGGMPGVLRAARTLRLTLLALRMHSINDAVVFPFVKEKLDGDGRFRADGQTDAGQRMLDELHKPALTLKPLTMATKSNP